MTQLRNITNNLKQPNHPYHHPNFLNHIQKPHSLLLQHQAISTFHIDYQNLHIHSYPTQTHLATKKITHQLNNEGCRCTLCQKIILNQMKQIKKVQIKDLQSQHSIGLKQDYLSKFLEEYFYIDKLYRRIKFILPEMCIFDKGSPVCLLTKKKDILPLKLLKNKEKMNAFQIQNFFMDGYIYHNNLKQNQQIMKNHKVTTLKKQYYKFDQYLKNQCIVLVKFTNNTCQMMTPIMLNNLFKSKQKNIRQQIKYIQTMACSQNYHQIRIHIDLTTKQYTQNNNQLYERAKNQTKIINENIKPKDFMYIPQREQRKYQEMLESKDQKQYLKYQALKLLLIYSLKTDILLQKSLFKFMKDERTGNFYLVDIQMYQKCSPEKLWGEFQKKKAQSPQKQHNNNIKRRPVSSPQKLQTRKTKPNEFDDIQLQKQMKKIILQAQDTDNFIMNSKKDNRTKNK